MFSWLGKGRDATVASTPKLDLDAIAQQERAILFKHSRTCPVSWAAQAEVRRFTEKHPEVPVYTIVVQEDREMSRRVAEWTGVTHESPQAIILQRGKVVTADSHEGVTEEYLTASVQR